MFVTKFKCSGMVYLFLQNRIICFRNIQSNVVHLLCPTLVDSRQLWATYFDDIGVKAVFWSAVSETERLNNLVSFFACFVQIVRIL